MTDTNCLVHQHHIFRQSQSRPGSIICRAQYWMADPGEEERSHALWRNQLKARLFQWNAVTANATSKPKRREYRRACMASGSGWEKNASKLAHMSKCNPDKHYITVCLQPWLFQCFVYLETFSSIIVCKQCQESWPPHPHHCYILI